MAKGKIAQQLADEINGILDMSDEARMARAREMGFNNPTLYHGTSTFKSDGDLFGEFQKFEGQDMTRSVSRSPVGKLGISLAEQPQVAEDFAYQASPADGSGAAILPVKFRHDKIASLNLDGDETNDEIYGAVVDAWKQGFDAIQFKNYTTPAGTKGSFVLVKDPSQIRSVNAAFDPAKKGSTNLLAGGLPIGAGTILAGGSLSPSDASARILPPTQDVGSIRAPVNNIASSAADMATQYNRVRKERLHPLLDMALPLGELPEELWRKRAYGEKVKISEYLKAAISML